MLQLRNYQQQLVNDVKQQFKLHHKRVLAVLPCGAGKTVCFAYIARQHILKYNNGYVWFLVHRRELIEQTKRTFREFEINNDNILIDMVQTVTRHIETYKKPTLIIFDEAHHSQATQWKRIIEHFNDVPIIGLTATPCRMDGKSLGDIYDTIVEGVSVNWLINNKYLCEYDYYAPHTNITDAEFKPKGSDYDLEDVSDKLEKAKIYGDVLKYIDYNRKTIIYCPSIAFSKKLCDSIPGAVHFDANTSSDERDKIINDFREGKIKILSNVNLIGEGFDVPDCDCVMLLRPTKSTALYIQQAMRCLRPGITKRAVIYDFVGNVFRHGLLTDKHEWSLTKTVKMRNQSSDKEVLVRECKHCFKVYKGTSRICPYCNFDNGKTQKEIEIEKQEELKKIEELERKKQHVEVGRCRTLDSLISLGRSRGYKNPEYWAKMIYNNRMRRM